MLCNLSVDKGCEHRHVHGTPLNAKPVPDIANLWLIVEIPGLLQGRVNQRRHIKILVWGSRVAKGRKRKVVWS